jgi:hypothetical protein
MTDPRTCEPLTALADDITFGAAASFMRIAAHHLTQNCNEDGPSRTEYSAIPAVWRRHGIMFAVPSATRWMSYPTNAIVKLHTGPPKRL